jgi:hypothetical protein
VKKLLGRNEIEDSLKRLDMLTQEEARMAIAEVLRVAHSINDSVKVVLEGAQAWVSGDLGCSDYEYL